MSVSVSVQRALADQATPLPVDRQIEEWVNTAVRKAGSEHAQDAHLTVRIVDEAEMSELNRVYRDKDSVTNVLSFPFELPPGMPAGEMETELGDIVVCAAVVENEARAQHKRSEAHWAHMVIHGFLHLLGYDHQQQDEAQQMESLETTVLDSLGYADPYQA